MKLVETCTGPAGGGGKWADWTRLRAAASRSSSPEEWVIANDVSAPDAPIVKATPTMPLAPRARAAQARVAVRGVAELRAQPGDLSRDLTPVRRFVVGQGHRVRSIEVARQDAVSDRVLERVARLENPAEVPENCGRTFRVAGAFGRCRKAEAWAEQRLIQERAVGW